MLLQSQEPPMQNYQSIHELVRVAGYHVVDALKGKNSKFTLEKYIQFYF